MNADGFENLKYKDWEIGFVILTKLLGMIIPNSIYSYIYYIGFFSVVTIVPAAIFIYKNSEMPWVSTVLYVNTFLFFMSMNFIRQAVALSIIMLAWHFMKKNKFIPFAVFVIIASLFHQTALLMLPVYLLVKMKITLKELIVYLYILLFFYISSTGFIRIITSFFHEEYVGSAFLNEGLSFVYAILPVIIVIIAFFLAKIRTINVTTETKYIINMTLICALLSITMSKHSIIERLTYYFTVFLILLVPIIYRSLRQNGIRFALSKSTSIELCSEKQKKIISFCVLIVILAFSYFNFYYGLSENAHGVLPYNTWI